MRSGTLIAIAATAITIAGAAALVGALLGPGGSSVLPTHLHKEGQLPRVCPTKGDVFARLGGPGGPRAVLHRLGARSVDDAARARVAPAPELFKTGTFAAEPTMAVARDGAVFFVGVECEDPDGAAKLTSRQLESRDDGRSWRDVSPRAAGGVHRHGATVDPYLYMDRDTERVFTADIVTVGGCAPISHRAAAGGGWATGEVCGLTDHQNIFTGPPATSATSGYPNVVYYCAADAGILAGYSQATACAKSLDGGLRFTRTGEPPFVAATQDKEPVASGCDGLTGQGFVGRDGTVFLPRGFCGQPSLAISHDEGQTWRRVQVSDLGVAQRSETDREHEANVVVDDAGVVYYFWIARDRMPYLAISRDGGGRFERPVMIAPPGVRETALPTLDIGSDGRLTFAYMGSTNSPGPPFDEAGQARPPDYEKVTWHGYATVMKDPLARDPLLYSATVNDPRDPLIRGRCGMIRCEQQYDFLDVVAAPDGSTWVSLADGLTADGKDAGAFGASLAARLPPLPEADRARGSDRDPPPAATRPGAGPAAVAPREEDQPACGAVRGLAAVAARPGRGGSIALAFTRRLSATVDVDVFQQSRGRRVVGERLVARFPRRARTVLWDGRPNARGGALRDGVYVVRYRMRLAGGRTDVRRVVLRRRGGRFTVGPPYYRAGCGLISSAKLERPVFGGPTNRALFIAYRLSRGADVRVVVSRRGRVVRRLASQGRRAGITHRLRFDAERRPRGDYEVTIEARRGSRQARRTLTARRL